MSLIGLVFRETFDRIKVFYLINKYFFSNKNKTKQIINSQSIIVDEK